MTIRDYLVSLIRTIVPVIVGWLLAQAAKAGLDLSAVAEPLVDALFIGGYYALVRWAETRWPWVGVLLGWKASPVYDDSQVLARVDGSGTFRAGPGAALPTGKVVAPEVTVERLVEPVTYDGTEGH